MLPVEGEVQFKPDARKLPTPIKRRAKIENKRNFLNLKSNSLFFKP